MLLGGKLPEMPHREVRVLASPKSIEFLNCPERDAFTTRGDTPMIPKCVHPYQLVLPANTSDLPGRDAQNVGRLQPGDFSFNGFRHDFLLGHRSGLLGDPLLEKLHASRVKGAETEADIFQCL